MKKDEVLLPRYRFPEFRDCGEWRNVTLENICSITTGKLDANAMVQDGQYRFYTCAKNYFKIDKYAFDLEALLISGNGANVGYIHYYKGKFNAYQRTYVLYEFKKNISYVKYFLEQNLPRRIESEKQDGNTPYIKIGTLLKMEVFVPLLLDEQQKIADCLSSIDELIGAEKKKARLLKKWKKGWMQRLFPKEGKREPEWRFPEFRYSGEWVNYELGEISDRITERVGNAKLTTLSISAGIGFISQKEKFSRDISGKQYQNYICIKKGDFAYNKGHSKKYPQGCIYELLEYEKAAVPNVFISFRFKSAYVSSFYKVFFENNFHGRQLIKYITSSARMDGLLNISPLVFFKILLPTPTQKQEQQKIATFLSSIDDLIGKQEKKIERLKQHKKALMQGLFPRA